MKKFFSYHETYVFLAIVIVALAITAVSPSFFTLENLFDMLKSYSLIGTFAIGVLFVLISGGIDISFTAIATITGYATAVLLLQHGDQLNIFLIFLITGVIGILLGSFNALIIYLFRIPSIITTIATLNIYYGILTVVSQGKWLYGFPEWFGKYTQMYVFTVENANGTSYGLSVITVFWFALLLLAWFILRFTVLGRSIYAMGGNIASASRAGFNLFKLHLFVYSFMGLMAGFASVIQALLVQTVAPNSLVGKELDVLAAVVLGGASLTGGTGSVIGTVLGVTLIAILGNGLTLMHVPSYWYKVVIGIVILISVSTSAYRRKLSTRQRVIIETE
ncbi:MAG: ABC transporter permease [Anaerolineales bacterium]|nr:ABC transporter permease [Anaerolineales bacterium]